MQTGSENQLKGYECIILAGGLGTRLRSAVPDLPKCMAPVAGKPFLQYLIDYLLKHQVVKFVFSLGYLHEVIESFLKKEYPYLDCSFSVEEEPLGTGGAIQMACSKTTHENVLVLNGDTFFDIDISSLMNFHQQHHSSCTFSLKPMQNFDRYGVVEINENAIIQSFHEKKHYQQGLINGGVYALRVNSFLQLKLPAKFSFEKDYFEKYVHSEKMMGLIQDSYFIDIGIPEDFNRASIELANLNK